MDIQDCKNEILVSVVIPAYNSAPYIARAVDSALMQDTEKEVIVVDDASDDGTQAVLSRYAGDERLVYLKNEHNEGAAASRNRGVAAARGKYIAYLDADDCWSENKLSRQIELMERTGAVICTTGRELMRPDGSLTGMLHPCRVSYGYRDILRENFICCSSVLLKAGVAREFPMCHDEAHEDYLCWLRLLKKYGRGCGIDEPLLKYRISRSSKSGSKLHSTLMTYKTYRCAGFPVPLAAYRLFILSMNTFIRYFKAYIKR